MSTGIAFYHLLGSLFCLKTMPLFILYARITGRYRAHLRERLGYVSRAADRLDRQQASIWLHAASLGEVKAAASILDALKARVSGYRFVVSVYTEHGRAAAENAFGDEVPVLYAPVDVWWAVGKALDKIRPKMVVFLETELWPAWLSGCSRRNIRTVVANGRISPRSFGSYMMLRPLFREVLSRVDAFSMIGEKDAKRIFLIGAPKERIWVNGNAKYDSLLKDADPACEAEVKKVLGMKEGGPVIVAGSTRAGEEEILLNAFLKVRGAAPGAILVLAPRHITRTSDVARIIVKAGMGFHLWSELASGKEPRTMPVVIVDTFGDLFRIYSSATIAFCGGSLVPLGGQNPLEPAAWGKPVFHGPSMEDFHDARELLSREGGAVEIDGSTISDRFLYFLGKPAELASLGERARKALAHYHRGAADRHAEIIAGLLTRQGI